MNRIFGSSPGGEVEFEAVLNRGDHQPMRSMVHNTTAIVDVLSFQAQSCRMANPFLNSDYRPFPPEVAKLLEQVSAPPRLVAHLVLVHDVASKLADRMAQSFPTVAFDREAVLFGAATHDIGKAMDRAELVQPGKSHEERGVELLRDMAIPGDRARFAFTHGNWSSGQDITLEDLLVALADNCWKGKRVDELESKTVELLSSASGEAAWTCYAELDEILGSLTADADSRLAWQGAFGTQ